MEQVTLGQLKVEGLPYQRIEKIQIDTRAGQHGICDLQFIALPAADMSLVQRIEGQPIKVLLKTELLFAGIITQAVWQEQAGYSCLQVRAVTLSQAMDIKRHSRTFQSESKTLSDVANAIGQPYGLQIAVQDNPVLPRMLYQHEETDWQFLVRLAETTGHFLFTNCASDRIQLSVGFVPFSKRRREKEDRIDAISLPVSTCRKVKENIRPMTAPCEFQDTGLATYDWKLTAGHGLEYEQRVQAVLESHIVSEDALLINRLTLRHKEGCRPEAEEELRRRNMPQQLSGTILAVDGTNVKVKFDCDEQQDIEEACWIPYENTVNNYQYSMPDVGDHVFVYFEENGEKVALGSHRGELGGNPDYEAPENRNLTSTNNMVQFQPNSVVMIAGRSGADSASITADDSRGISVVSNHDVVVHSGKDIVIQSGTDSVDDKSGKVAPGFCRGYDKYIGDGGQALAQTLQLDIAAGKIGQDASLSKSLGAPKEAPVTSDLGKDLFRQSGQRHTTSPMNAAIEDFATGVSDGRINVEAGQAMTLKVGGNWLCLDGATNTVALKAPLVAGEGYIHNQYPQERTTEDIEMNNLSLAVDVALMAACFTPVGPVASVILSLKIIGEDLEAGNKKDAAIDTALAMLPVAGNIFARTKRGAEAIRSASNGLKAARLAARTKIDKAWGALKKFASDHVSLEKIDKAIIQGAKARPWLRSKMGNLPKNVVMSCGRKSSGNKMRDRTALNGAPEKAKNTTPAVSGTQNAANGKTSVADPIDAVTGSFCMTVTDYRQKDFVEDFLLTRTYESIYENPGQHLGRRWLINVGSALERREKQVRILCADMHLEKFALQADGSWQNERGGDRGIMLAENETGYQLENRHQQKTYFYNKSGQLTDMVLCQKAKIHIEYHGRQIQTVRLADGQELSFLYAEDKIAQITDGIGRTICYEYEDDLLTCVTYPNGGQAKYTYTPEGWIRTVTDLNGICYLQNDYDREGRVLHQQMKNGAEYLLFYDDQNRRTTVTDQHNGKRVTYHWNRQHLVEKTVYPDDTTAEKAYDERENVIYEKDRLGRETKRTYNEASQLLREELPSGLTRQLAYDGEGRLQEETDSEGGCVRYRYDKHGWLIARETKLGEGKWKKESWQYDFRGRVLTQAVNGCETTYSYEGTLPVPSSMMLPEGGWFNYEYDKVCRLMCIQSEFGERSFGYDVMDYRACDIDALGHMESWQYDLMGNLQKHITPKEQDKGADQQVSRYVYDSMDHCILETAPEGIVYARAYDAEGNLIKEVHPEAYDPETGEGEGTLYDYDTDGHKIRIHYPDGGVERRFYDAEGNLCKRVTPNHYDASTDDGAGMSYTYDAGNRRTTVKNEAGDLLEVSRYDAKGRCIYHQDAGQLEASRDGMVYATNYKYDLAGNKLEERKAVAEKDGAIQYSLRRWTYDIHGNIIEEKTWLTLQSETSASGLTRIIRQDYDKQNRLIRVTDNLGAEVKYTYNSIGKRTSEERKINAKETQRIAYRYDKAGRLIDRAEELNKKRKGNWWSHTHYTYDANGNITEIQLPDGSKIQRGYDAADRLVAECIIDHASGQKNTTRFTYDKAGNILRITDDCGRAQSFTYNLLNQRTQAVTSEGRRQELIYDHEGNVTERRLPQGMTYRYRYDSAGRLTTVIGTDDQVLETVAYDRAGRRIKAETAAGGGAAYAYTAAGWQTKIATNGGASQAYHYDAQGNVTGIVDGNGNETSYVLDSWGRITEIRKADGSKENYSYDFAGNITEAVDGNGNKRTYEYDDNNQLKAITYPDGSQEEYLYTADGKLIQFQDRNGITNEYQWNVYGSLIERKAGNLRNSYEYAPNGQLTAAIANGMDYRYSYDRDGLLLAKKASGRTLLSYRYDELGRKISQTDITGRQVSYKFDKSNYLVDICNEIDQSIVKFTRDADGAIQKITHANGMWQDITYDADKNITSLTVATPDKILAKNTYRYDGNGQRIEKSELAGKTLYTYDSLNRLQQAEYPTYTERFSYDQAGNRLTRTAKDIEEQYIYDVNNRLTSQIVNGQVENYRYDNAGNLLQDGNNIYEYDAFRRTSKVTTKAGITQINRYDAFGNTIEAEEQIPNRYQYTGQQLDPLT